MEKVSFFALGGQDEKGKHAYVLQVGSDIYLVDAGVKHPVVTTLGIDTVIPNFKFLKRHANNFQGVFVSNAHDYAAGALPWLVKQVPRVKVFASPFVAATIRTEMRGHQINPGSYKVVEVTGQQLRFSNLTVDTFELSGSMPGAVGWNFHTPQGDVVYMSSFVLNNVGQGFAQTDLARIKAQVGPQGILFLALDCGTANYHGYANDKCYVRNVVENVVKNHPSDQRVVFGVYEHEMQTVQEIMALAYDYNRPVVVYGSGYSRKLNVWQKLSREVVLPKMVDYHNAEKVNNAVVVVTGLGTKLYQEMDKISNNQNPFLKLCTTDLVVMIAPPVNGHEKFAARTENKIAEITPYLTDVPRDSIYPFRPAASDVRRVVQTLKPQYFFPLHGLYCYLLAAKQIARETNVTPDRVVILQNARQAVFQNQKLVTQKARVPGCQEVIIDGLGIGDVVPGVIIEREKLAREGLLVLSLVINKKTHKLVQKPAVKSLGVMTGLQRSDLPEFITEKVEQVLREQKEGKKLDYHNLQKTIRAKIQRLVKRQIYKSPVMVVNIFEV